MGTVRLPPPARVRGARLRAEAVRGGGPSTEPSPPAPWFELVGNRVAARAVVQRMMSGDDDDADTRPAGLPRYLFHATSLATARIVATSRLEARSTDPDSDLQYLCVSGTWHGAVTLEPDPNDVVIRIDTNALAGAELTGWVQRGAGGAEWRLYGQHLTNVAALAVRRKLDKLGDPTAVQWRPLTAIEAAPFVVAAQALIAFHAKKAAKKAAAKKAV